MIRLPGFIIGIISAFFLLVSFDMSSRDKRKLDSLFTLLKNERSDTIKVKLHLKIAADLMQEDSLAGLQEIRRASYLVRKIGNTEFELRFLDKAARIHYGANMLLQSQIQYQKGLLLAKENGLRDWESVFFARLAYLLLKQNHSSQCIAYYDSALSVNGIKNQRHLAETFMYRGRAHYENGDYKPAMEDYIQSQSLFEKNKWKDDRLGHLYHFIGSIFKRQKQYEKAGEYYEKELALAREIKDKELEAEALYLCAQAYGSQGDTDRDLDYVKKALAIYEEAGNIRAVALMYNNLSAIYSDRGELVQATSNMERAHEMYQQLDDREGLANTTAALGNLYSKTGKHSKAIAMLEEAKKITETIESKRLLNLTNLAEDMAFAHYRKGDYKAGFDWLLEHRTLNDSLNDQSNVEFLHDLETKYQTEKKEKEIALLNAEAKLQNEELEAKRNQQMTLIAISVLGIVIAAISVIAFINKRKTSRLLKKQVDEINYQNAVIKEKNKDITDSIQYAKRLQEAVFPEADQLNTFFAESFVLFRPRDIVSGDFYWFDEAQGKTFLIVGDCTGHGVPGAFMSILGHNLLNQIILEEKNSDPAEILRLLDKRVTNALNKKNSGKEHNDGMDIAVCVIDKNKTLLSFAGANRPLIIRHGNELRELKANKFAIGGREDDRCKLFLKHEVQFNANDVCYLFSDGYYDQFGGPDGKKFKYKQLIDKLNAIATLPMEEQKQILASTFSNWQGKLEQLDDVCVVGVRL